MVLFLRIFSNPTLVTILTTVILLMKPWQEFFSIFLSDARRVVLKGSLDCAFLELLYLKICFFFSLNSFNLKEKE